MGVAHELRSSIKRKSPSTSTNASSSASTPAALDDCPGPEFVDSTDFDLARELERLMDGEQLCELDESAQQDGDTLAGENDDLIRQVEEARAEQTEMTDPTSTTGDPAQAWHDMDESAVELSRN